MDNREPLRQSTSISSASRSLAPESTCQNDDLSMQMLDMRCVDFETNDEVLMSKDEASSHAVEVGKAPVHSYGEVKREGDMPPTFQGSRQDTNPDNILKSGGDRESSYFCHIKLPGLGKCHFPTTRQPKTRHWRHHNTKPVDVLAAYEDCETKCTPDEQARVTTHSLFPNHGYLFQGKASPDSSNFHTVSSEDGLRSFIGPDSDSSARSQRQTHLSEEHIPCHSYEKSCASESSRRGTNRHHERHKVLPPGTMQNQPWQNDPRHERIPARSLWGSLGQNFPLVSALIASSYTISRYRLRQIMVEGWRGDSIAAWEPSPLQFYCSCGIWTVAVVLWFHMHRNQEHQTLVLALGIVSAICFGVTLNMSLEQIGRQAMPWCVIVALFLSAMVHFDSSTPATS